MLKYRLKLKDVKLEDFRSSIFFIFFFGTEMEASSFRPFGYPLSYYMTCQGSLLSFVILIFWFAGRQEKIDEEFGFTEREDD